MAFLPDHRGCRNNVVRSQSDLGGADLRVGVRLKDARGDVNLPATDGGWSPIAPFTPVKVSGGQDERLSLHSRSFGTGLGAQRQGVPQWLPALVTPGMPAAPYSESLGSGPSGLVEAPAVGGSTRIYERQDAIPAVPGMRDANGDPRPALLVSYDLAALDGPVNSHTLEQVWLDADDSAREARLVQSLSASGVRLVERMSAADEAERLASQGSGLALRLALLVGAIALVLAALVVSVATSGRVRAHDLAGLLVEGAR